MNPRMPLFSTNYCRQDSEAGDTSALYAFEKHLRVKLQAGEGTMRQKPIEALPNHHVRIEVYNSVVIQSIKTDVVRYERPFTCGIGLPHEWMRARVEPLVIPANDSIVVQMCSPRLDARAHQGGVRHLRTSSNGWCAQSDPSVGRGAVSGPRCASISLFSVFAHAPPAVRVDGARAANGRAPRFGSNTNDARFRSRPDRLTRRYSTRDVSPRCERQSRRLKCYPGLRDGLPPRWWKWTGEVWRA